MAETVLQREIMRAVSKTGARVFRNNVGVAHYPDGSVVKYGLCVGSSDLIGFTKYGRFLAIEVKDRTKPTKEQENFLNAVNEAGGIGILARSVEDVLSRLEGESPIGPLFSMRTMV